MSGTFIDLWNEVAGHVPPLSPFLAQKFVNRAWKTVREARDWSFLFGEGALVIPAEISAGTVAVTRGSQEVTADETAKLAFDSADFFPPLTERQIRIGNGDHYMITGYNTETGTLTLDRPWVDGATTAASSYAVRRIYFAPPDKDFLRFESVIDSSSRRCPLRVATRQEIDRLDPNRTSHGDPTHIFASRTDVSGHVPLYELWPQPTEGVLRTVYRKRGRDLVLPTDRLPAAIDEQIIIEGALFHASRWAQKNVGRFPELQGGDWRTAAETHKRESMILLQRARVQDDETSNISLMQPHLDHGYGHFGLEPIDRDF